MSQKLLLLDDFIRSYAESEVSRNSHVRAFGFRTCYVRISPRYLLGAWRKPTLDLASITAQRPGRGTFTKLLLRLRSTYPDLTIFVESVASLRFRARLEALGFVPVLVDNDAANWVLLPAQPLLTNTEELFVSRPLLATCVDCKG